MVCRVLAARSLALTPAPLDPAQVVEGHPTVSVLDLVETDTYTVGVWEHTAGVSTDTESDEIFVVLSGRATVEVLSEAAGTVLTLAAGDVGILEAGAQTRWTIHETLRKVYVVPR